MYKYIAGAGLTALLLTGCGAASEPAATVTVTETAQPTTAPMSDSDSYLAALYATGDITLANMDESSLINIGNSTCELLDEGVTVSTLAVYLVENGGFTTSQYETIGRIIGAAVYNLCPEYSYQIDQLTESY